MTFEEATLARRGSWLLWRHPKDERLVRARLITPTIGGQLMVEILETGANGRKRCERGTILTIDPQRAEWDKT